MTMLLSDRAVLAFMLLIRGCATAEPESTTDDSGGRSLDKACAPTKNWGASRDALGRLVTAPGLCRIAETSKMKPSRMESTSPETNVEVEFTYDGFGRPVEVNLWFVPYCPTGGLGGDRILSDDRCWTYEHHIQRWTWDGSGRLVGAEEVVSASMEPGSYEEEEDHTEEQEEDKTEFDDDIRCLLTDDAVTLHTERWSYDDTGRLTTYTSTYHDCVMTAILEERLDYGVDVVDATAEGRDDAGSWTTLTRYHLDDGGRVVSVEGDPSLPRMNARYGYDEHGRLTSVVNWENKERRWTYDTGIAASMDQPWTIEISSDSHFIWLVRDLPPDPDRFEIRLDEHNRVVAIEMEHVAWTLTYDDCPNAAFAQSRWRVHELLSSSWSFPTPPQPGYGYTALDTQLNEARWLWSHL